MPIGNIYAIAATSVIGGALFGFDISSLSAQLGENSYKCYFNQGPQGPPFNDSPDCSGPHSLVQGGITAAMAAGSWLGALASGFVSDRLGRKYSIILGSIIWMIGSAISCASQNIGMLVAGRVINGLAVGIESAAVPTYIAELAPPSKRGRLIGLQQWAITWGILIMYFISFGSANIGGRKSYNYSTTAFRLPWGLQMVPGALLCSMMLLLPESPRWLARKDRWEEAKNVLILVHGHGDPNHPFVNYELEDIKNMCEFERKNSNVTYLDLVKPKAINRTLIGLFIQIWSQLTGMNVMMYYVSNVFSMTGKTSNANLVSSAIQFVVNVICTVPSLIWVDRWGRRPTLLVGSVLMAVFMFANAGILATYGRIVPGGVGGVAAVSMSVSDNISAGNGILACTYLFVASYAITWGPVSWIYPPEVLSLSLRGKGVALATSANWAFNTALGLFVPVAFENIKWRTYLIFGIFNAAAAVHTFFIFPETAGKSLEEIENMFSDPNGIPYIGTPAWKTKTATHATSRAEQGDLEAKLGPTEHAEKPALTQTVQE